MLSPIEVLKRIPAGTLIVITSKIAPGTRRAVPAREIVKYQSHKFKDNFRQDSQQYQVEVTQSQFRANEKGELTEKITEMRFYERNIESITVI